MSKCKAIDKDSKIITWKNSENFTYMNTDDFPTELAKIIPYFQGYRANIKANKRVYFKKELRQYTLLIWLPTYMFH